MTSFPFLFYAHRKAKKAGELSFASSRLETRYAIEHGTMQVERTSLRHHFGTFKQLLDETDLMGLFLLAMSFALILLTFSLTKDAKGGWANPSMIAMIVCGFVILLGFIAWELKWSNYPMLNKRVWRNKTFICAVIIDIFYLMSSSTRSTYFSTWVYVIKSWGNYDWENFLTINTVGAAFFGLLAGLYRRVFHRYKILQIFGLSIRLVGLGITYWAVGPNASTGALVMFQILISMGGACSVVGTRVASQASVPHQDLAAVISQLSLWSKLGSSVGSAIASSLYTNTYLDNLLLEGLSPWDAKVFYASGTKARTRWAMGTEQREAGIRGFTSTVRPMFLIAICLSVIPLVVGLLMPNYYLGKTQNDVDGTTNGGIVIDEGQDHGRNELIGQEEKKSWFTKLWARS
ncbi:major facilitator superfamily domain-containing protein [Rhexocercosporidium sp. MPI-PUGE-AT-0058]|nr:major facilitator superfamily domain-containing protein [Rhexocercosporidium sp. MPI-PUGE-AT-0058]